MRISLVIPSAVALFAISACGADNGPASPLVSSNTIVASVNGAEWNGSTIRFASWTNDALVVSGQNAAGVAVVIAIPEISSEGTFSLDSTNEDGALGSIVNGPRIWASSMTGGTGTVTITLLSPTRVAGTFTFTALPSTDEATGSMSVTAGAFDLNM